jgi:dTDP-4-dehydrorhamnose 3,5-epimerase
VCENRQVLPAGVRLHELVPHGDERGVFTELFRTSWELEVAPVQWNVVRTGANVLRGVHVHHRHADYLTLVDGRATIGLSDLREESPTDGLSAVVEFDAAAPAALVIPPGVAHGFYFAAPSIHVYAVSHEWDPSDELGCRWDDPDLEIAWPCSAPLISPRDAALGRVSELRAAWREMLARAGERQSPASLAAGG